MTGDFRSERAPEPVGAFPHAKRVGPMLFLSGIGPRTRDRAGVPGVTVDEAGNVLTYDFQLQCRTVFDNVRAVISC